MVEVEESDSLRSKASYRMYVRGIRVMLISFPACLLVIWLADVGLLPKPAAIVLVLVGAGSMAIGVLVTVAAQVLVPNRLGIRQEQPNFQRIVIRDIFRGNPKGPDQ